MAEYISREQLLERIASQKCEVRETVCKECDIKSFCVYGVVECFPAADVAPVQHGKWLNEWGNRKVCSTCGWAVTVDMGLNEKLDIPIGKISPFWAYCPNCGAKLDGGGNE